MTTIQIKSQKLQRINWNIRSVNYSWKEIFIFLSHLAKSFIYWCKTEFIFFFYYLQHTRYPSVTLVSCMSPDWNDFFVVKTFFNFLSFRLLNTIFMLSFFFLNSPLYLMVKIIYLDVMYFFRIQNNSKAANVLKSLPQTCIFHLVVFLIHF